MLLVLLINFFLTKILEKQSFGNYSYILIIFNFSQVIFNFGYFYSISRRIAILDSNADHREFYGVGLLVALLLSIIMALCLLSINSIYNIVSSKEIVNSFLFCIPLSFIFTINNYNEILLQAGNKISLLSFSRFTPKFIFLVLLMFIYFFLRDIVAMNTILTCFIISSIIPFLVILYRLKPKMSNYKMRIIELHKANINFGFNIYIGSLFAVGASSFSGLLIGYFGINNTEVGFYSIALQLSAPLSLIPNVIATTSYKKFANSNYIDKSTLKTMYLMSLFVLVMIFIVAKSIILIVYGIDYLECVSLVYFLSLGSVFYGISDFYNKFLSSKGKGIELRNSSFIVGLVLITSNFILIPYFGAKGAAVATIISGISYYLIIVYYYKKVIKEYKEFNELDIRV